MVVVICSICGETASADAKACPSCEATDFRAVPEEELPASPEERLIANAHRTVEKINELHKSRARQLDRDAEARVARALRVRAEGQVGVIEARLRDEQEQRDTAAYHAELTRLKRELLASL
jgi:uncharacterized Zn finger protein (UPF0148 family)